MTKILDGQQVFVNGSVAKELEFRQLLLNTSKMFSTQRASLNTLRCRAGRATRCPGMMRVTDWNECGELCVCIWQHWESMAHLQHGVWKDSTAGDSSNVLVLSGSLFYHIRYPRHWDYTNPLGNKFTVPRKSFLQYFRSSGLNGISTICTVGVFFFY